MVWFEVNLNDAEIGAAGYSDRVAFELSSPRKLSSSDFSLVAYVSSSEAVGVLTA